VSNTPGMDRLAELRQGHGESETGDDDKTSMPEPPRPLMREMPPADPFPINALGDVLAPAARAIHDRIQAPPAICAQAVLAAATLAVQAHGDIELPTGQVRPLTEYFISVAASGERKTAVDTEALWPVRKREAALREDYEGAYRDYINEKTAWEKAREVATKRGRGDRTAIKAALDVLGPAPTAPLVALLTCPEPTYEGLCKLFAIGPPSLGIFAAEGGQFIGGPGMAEEVKLRMAAGLSAAWDGEPIRRVRAADGTVVLPGRRLAMHLMAQPDIAGILFRDGLLADQGLLSRLLVTAPDSAAGQRAWHEPSPASDAALRRYGARLLDTLEHPLPLAPDKLNELAPRLLLLSPPARHLWVAFYGHIEARVAPGGELHPIAALCNKLPEHAARLAAVLSLVNNIGATEVDASQMQSGIELAQHYCAEALRLFGASQIDADLKLAQRLLEWLHATWHEPAVSLPDVYQKGPTAIRDKAMANRMMAILEDHGWVRRIKNGAIVAGQQRREAWLIIRE
jgi:hypothetical protein